MLQRRPLHGLPNYVALIPLTSVCKGVALDGIGLRSKRNGLFSATNLNSVLAVVRNVYVCKDPVVKATILPFLNFFFETFLHPTPTAGVMVRGAIPHDTRSPLILIYSTMTAQRYISDIFQPFLLPPMAGFPRAIFQQDNARLHAETVSQDCLSQITSLPWPIR